MRKIILSFAFSALLSFSAWSALAGGVIPECMSKGQAIPVDNQAVITMKTTTANQFLARAHVSGSVTSVFADHSGHNHFEITMGPDASDTLEVVYNISFGALPAIKNGMSIEACGDFINSDAPTSQYPASPDGAIIHWIHRNPSGKGHDSGFLVINGTLYGQGNGNGSFQ